MALLRTAGIALAATGLAHFAAPKAFEPISKLAFPNDTDAWIKRNGATELALGVALAVDKTRKAGLVGTAVYTAWLGARAAANRKSS
ncbi:hypothetical protein J4573_38830 [Actinomadura barringtoniae]|uniref:DoxX family membrane protein n=1 Tax=Actinomadura barringtoniae TaxID=1427535 RepID=A0A939PHR3_9ACTN|nr:hypothetical protein [Actinomadura barringtoniae]MBO2453102.1 hypothetical protein [Actinomadura barringtoniae]